MNIIVSISGKMGSGKDYLATQLTKEYPKNAIIRFADGLKEEVSDLVMDISLAIEYKRDKQDICETLAVDYDCSKDDIKKVYDYLKKENTEDISSHNLRWLYQFWGTDVRRKQDEDYWLKKYYEKVSKLPNGTLVVTPDARFENEVEYVKQLNGITVDLFTPEPIRMERLMKRDGKLPSKEKLTHPSETSLEDYDKFSVTLITGMFSDEQMLEIIKEAIQEKS